MTSFGEFEFNIDVDGLMQESHNSIANALELRLYCTKPWMCTMWNILGPNQGKILVLSAMYNLG